MFRFLRKHSKWILAIFGTLLMVVFLVPQAIQSFAQQAARGSGGWAMLAGEKLGPDSYDQATGDLELFKFWGMQVGQFGVLENPGHWYLLTMEADRAGLIGGRGSNQFNPIDQQRMQQANFRSDNATEASFARYHGVRRLLSMGGDTMMLSDRRMERIAKHLFYGLKARVLVLDARDRPEDPDPTAAEIQAHFDAWGDVEPGEGDHGFGYRLPDRFKLEYLLVTGDVLRENIKASGVIDQVALFEHWSDNPRKKNFPALPGDDAATIPEIPAIVRTDLLETLVDERRNEITKLVQRRIHESQASIKRGVDGYFQLPADWSELRVSYATLAEEIQAGFGIELPATVALGDKWLAVADINTDEALGPLRGASNTAYSAPVTLTKMIEGLKEFAATPIVSVQSGVTAPPLQTATGDLIIARVTAVDAARAPENADEVRDRLVTDLKRLADFERIVARRDAIVTAARNDGILTAAMANDATVSGEVSIHRNDPGLVPMMLNAGQLFPFPASLPVIGTDVDTIDEIIEYAIDLPQDVQPETLPAEQRVMSVISDAGLALVIVDLKTSTPLSRSLYSQLSTLPALQAMVLLEQFEDLGPDMVATFDFESMSERYEFEVIRRSSAEDELADEEAAANDGLAAAETE